MNLGNIPIGKMFVGDTPVKKAYLGSTKVWPLYDAEVEYLESTGTQWIETPIKISYREDFEVTCEGQIINNDRAVWLGDFSNNSNQTVLNCEIGGTTNSHPYTARAYCRTAPTIWDNWLGQHALNDNVSINIVYNAATHRITATDGIVSVDTTLNIAYNATTWSLAMFLDHRTSSQSAIQNPTRLQHIVVRQGNKHWDFIPVRKGNVGYMYDRVSGKLFGNQGTGAFRYGRDIIPVEYLESSGTQWIDTGINANSNLTVQASFTMQNLAASNYGFLFGSRPAKQSKTYAVVFTTKSIGYLVGDGAFSYAGYSSLNVKHTVEIRNDGMLYSDGSLINQVYRGVVTSNTLPLYLFGVNTNGVFDNTQPFIGRVYNTQIYDNNELVRDFIPAKDENGVGFMFDKVSHTIYDNAGSGAFITGPETI